MKPHIRRFCKNIERNILSVGSEDILSEYRSHMLSIVTSHLSVDSLLDGIDQVRMLEAVRNSLQFIADSYSSHAIGPQIWNPFVACTLQALIDEVRTQQPSDLRLKITGTQEKPKQALRKPSEVKTADRGSAGKTLASTSKTKEHQAQVPPASSTDEIRRQVETTLKQHKKHPFFNSPAVRCRDALCRFCCNAAKHVPLTPCSSRKSHGKGKCHSSGYWPHIGATLWAKWKHPHNAGADFSISTPLALVEGALPPVSGHIRSDPSGDKIGASGITSPIAGLTSDGEATQDSTSSYDLSKPGAWAHVVERMPLKASPSKRPRRVSVHSQSSLSSTEG